MVESSYCRVLCSWKESKKCANRTGSKTVAKSESDDGKEDMNAIGNDGAQPGVHDCRVSGVEVKPRYNPLSHSTT